ncbi:MAG TPA: alpha-ketoacid dehydrogenase subunit beta, partial [Gammaproteobacteria bacterium]|nr:alpha-ketoacid dehydrogenase subunit beta [Gammaproteobacteria bacterium]
MPNGKTSYRRAVYSALDHLLSTDDRVVFLGEDIGGYGGAFGVAGDLAVRHPERVISTPISEGGFTGVGVGLAMTGYRPVIEIMFMDFLTLAMDQLVNHA